MNAEAAVKTLVFGPIIVGALGLIVGAILDIGNKLQPRTNGPFQGSMDSVGDGLATSFSLFQLGSTIETVIAVIVLMSKLAAKAGQIPHSANWAG